MSIITFTTDFGTADGYVGEMKGVILRRVPNVTLVDITHEIPPGDVEGAAWTLGRVWDQYPGGSVHLVVVDPGVGGRRRGVAVAAAGRWFVGPDNGLLTRVLGRCAVEEACALDPARFVSGRPSATFHGRDVFAPAAASVAAGRRVRELGSGLSGSDLVRLPIRKPTRGRDRIRGRVAHIDRFGNLVTDIPAGWLTPTALIEVGGEVISGLKSSYVSVAPGARLALIGSAGTLEIAVRDGHAARRLNVRRGDAVRVRPERD